MAQDRYRLLHPGGRARTARHIGDIMHFWGHSADASLEWTRGLIERIEGGTYTFEGEGERFVGAVVIAPPPAGAVAYSQGE